MRLFKNYLKIILFLDPKFLSLLYLEYMGRRASWERRVMPKGSHDLIPLSAQIFTGSVCILPGYVLL